MVRGPFPDAYRPQTDAWFRSKKKTCGTLRAVAAPADVAAVGAVVVVVAVTATVADPDSAAVLASVDGSTVDNSSWVEVAAVAGFGSFGELVTLCAPHEQKRRVKTTKSIAIFRAPLKRTFLLAI